MTPMVKDLSVNELREVIHDTVREAIEDQVEDLQALRSESYRRSIEEAREDYRAGNVTSLEDLLDD